MMTAPFIYGMIVPVVFLDICLEIYHRLCFPVYGIPYVNRSHYIIVDRQKLDYLDWFMKISCAYCGYVNGLFNYAAAIAGETEKYWCAIMHAKGKPLEHQKEFIPYGDNEAYRKYLADAKEASNTKRDARKEAKLTLLFIILLVIAFILYT